ncbi:MAG: hypothetical protein VXW91_09910 [Pseudomonadota bacterium]|nr:hypothetical protein [Pseudomonadota bacterium]MEC8665474.1 hypothetical protein [Pseudomonadota bacterium]
MLSAADKQELRDIFALQARILSEIYDGHPRSRPALIFEKYRDAKGLWVHQLKTVALQDCTNIRTVRAIQKTTSAYERKP